MNGPGSFLVEFMKYPATVGSVCPSSKALAAKLIAGVSSDDDGLVIDLGAGSGSVAAHMVRTGIALERIIAIEALADFTDAFTRRCPGVSLVIADARDLGALLDQKAPGRKISAIVSSLPFRALGPQLTSEILREVRRVLQERGGVLVQYSYAWWLRYPLKEYGFLPASAALVCKNIPPARVESYQAAPLSALQQPKRQTVNDRLLRIAAASVSMAGSVVLRTAFIAIRMSIGAVSYTWGCLARIVR